MRDQKNMRQIRQACDKQSNMAVYSAVVFAALALWALGSFGLGHVFGFI